MHAFSSCESPVENLVDFIQSPLSAECSVKGQKIAHLTNVAKLSVSMVHNKFPKTQ